MTSRPGELARHGEGWYRFISGDERATRLQLGPFGTKDLASLSRALGAGELSPAGATSLLRHTGGNPLYCATLLRELGAGTLGDQKGWLRVPKSLSSIILVRMARMTVDARALVTAAAALGPRCPLALAVQLAGTADPLGALDQAVSVSFGSCQRGTVGSRRPDYEVPGSCFSLRKSGGWKAPWLAAFDSPQIRLGVGFPTQLPPGSHEPVVRQVQRGYGDDWVPPAPIVSVSPAALCKAGAPAQGCHVIRGVFHCPGPRGAGVGLHLDPGPREGVGQDSVIVDVEPEEASPAGERRNLRQQSPNGVIRQVEKETFC